MAFTTRDLPVSLRLAPVAKAVDQALRGASRPADLTGLGPCEHSETPLRGVRCPECWSREAASAR